MHLVSCGKVADYCPPFATGFIMVRSSYRDDFRPRLCYIGSPTRPPTQDDLVLIPQPYTAIK